MQTAVANVRAKPNMSLHRKNKFDTKECRRKCVISEQKKIV